MADEDVTGTDEELTQDELADLEKPPELVPPEPAPVEGPSTEPPNVVDRVLAAPAPAVPTPELPDLPGGVPNVPAPGAPAPGGAAPAMPNAEATIRARGELEGQKAEQAAKDADAAAEEAAQHDMQRRLLEADTATERQRRLDDIDRRVRQFDKDRDLRDPRSSWTKWDKIRNAAAIVFGAVGAGLSAAGGTPTGNQGLAAVNRQLEEETQRRKFNLEREGDALVMARTGLKDADQARAELLKDEDARYLSRLNTLEAHGRASLRAQGKTEAQIATDERLVALQQARQAALIKLKDDANKQALIVAQTSAATARAKLDTKKAGKVGGGGGGSPDATMSLQEAIDSGASNTDLAAIAKKSGMLRTPKGRAEFEKALADARAARKASADAKKADKSEDEATAVRDDQGAVIGHVPTGRGGAQGFATRDADYGRALTQLEALRDDVAQNGERVLMPGKTKQRSTLYHNAVIGVATVSPLGKTNEAMEAEAGSLGSSGAGTGAIAGANLDAINRKIEELKEQRDRYRKETLIPAKTVGAPPAASSPPAAAAAKADPGKVARARAIVADPKLTDAQKAGARGFLASAGQ